jgi:hypothetical protein
MDGDTIFISSLEDADDTTYKIEFQTVSRVVWTGTVARVYIDSTFTNSYAISQGSPAWNSRCGKVINIASLTSYCDTFVKNLGGDLTTASVVANHLGAKRDSITLTFTSATAFTVVGSEEGSYGAGSTLSDYEPTNAGTSSAYFLIPSAAWSGTNVIGNTVTFEIYPAVQGIWAIEHFNEPINSKSNNSTWLMIVGESA